MWRLGTMTGLVHGRYVVLLSRPTLWSAGLLLALAVGVIGPLRAQASAESSTNAAVVAVHDATRIDVQLEDGTTEQVRLLGLAAGSTDESGAQLACGMIDPVARVHELIGDQHVTLEFDTRSAERDVAGRALAHVWLPQGDNLGQLLL